MVKVLYRLLTNKQTLSSFILWMGLFSFSAEVLAQGQFICNGQSIDEIVVNNLVLEQGQSLQVGAVYRQSNTYPGVDALVSIVSKSPGFYIENIDNSVEGHYDAFQPVIYRDYGYSQGFVDFEITFVESQTNTSTTIPHIMYSAIDIDGNGDNVREFVKLSNVDSYVVDQNTDVSVINLGDKVKFTGPYYAESLNLSHYKINGTVHSYNSSGFTYRCGISGGNSSISRHFALYFHCIDYQDPDEEINVEEPNAYCSDLVVELDDNGTANITDLQINNNSSSPVDYALSLSKDSFDYNDVGDNQVTLTVTDAFGQTSTCTANVRVESRVPEIICPDDITTNTNSGCYRSGLDIGTPVTTGSAPIVSVVSDEQDQYITGVHVVTWTVTDALGDIAQCQQTITIVDEQFPVFVPCVSDVTVFVDDDDCEFSTLLQAPVVSDNCGIESLTSDTDYPLPLGTTTITWTVVDPSGHSATCIQNVNVVDNTAPSIVCPNETIVEAINGLCGVPGPLSPPSVNDACGIASITSNAPNPVPVGSTDVTWTVTDNNGNISTCSQTVIVEDNLPPEITCPPNVSVLTSGSSEFVNVGQPTYSDDCGIASYFNSFNNSTDASGTYPVGTTSVTWTVIDNSGNQSTCIMTVTVTDNEAPPINCPDNVDVSSANGACEANVTLDIPTVVGGEQLASLVNDFNNTNNASGVYPVGQTVVVWTATDVNGNQSTCSMLVTVTDDTSPTVSCPSDINENASGGSCDANVVNLGTPVVSDACGIASVTNNAPATFPVGTTIVTWTVTDIHGNTSTCQQSVTLIDNTPPEITCPANILASADAGLPSAFISVPLPNATDDCGIDSYVNSYNGTSNASDVYPIGVTTVTWTVTDNNGNEASCSMTITVQDDEGPQIDCPPNVDVDAGANECETTVNVDVPFVSDNAGIASIVNDFNNTDNASGVYPVGSTVVTWTVTDLSGLTSSCSMTVTVNDVTSPPLTCPQDQIVDIDGSNCMASNVVLTQPTVQDACGVSTITNNAPNEFTVGSTQVIWTVTDNNGNVSTCSLNVIVQDNNDPIINCPPNVSINTDPGVAVASVTVGFASATDDCGIESLINDHTGTNNASGVYPIGTTLVTWIATDNNGNTATCTMTVTVSDGEAPIIDCPSNPSVNAAIGQCEAFVNVGVPVVQDNDGIATLINDFNNTSDASGVYPVGQTTVTWTATDFNGNISTCIMTVTVVDVTPPTINCPPDINASVDDNGCGATNLDINNPNVSDECGLIASATNDAPNTLNVGPNIITWTVEDVNGNQSTCTQIVTIIDDVPPTIVCPDNITVNTDNGVSTASVTVPPAQVSDNCGVDNVVNSFNGTSNASGVYPQGVTIVTWTVTDDNGLTASCSMTVTVIDSEGPELDCPDNVSVDAATTDCEAEVTIDIPTPVDNDGIASLVNDFNGTNDASGTYPVGETIVIWTATDNSGNSSSCSMTVTVLDITPPNLLCPQPIDVIADAGSCAATEVNLGGVNVSDACGILSVEPQAPESFPVGTTTYTWTAIDNSGNVSVCEATVTVIDDQAPVIDCPATVDAATDEGFCYATGVDLGTLSADDNCGIATVTNDAQEPFSEGSTIVTWTVTDVHGNVTTCEQEIIVTDDQEPNVFDPGDLYVDTDINSCEVAGLVLDDLTISDNCFGDVTITNNLDDFLPLPIGTTTITWTIVDADGNVTTVTQDIIVEDNQLPEIICPDDITVDNEFRECWQIVDVEIPSATDNCEVSTIINDYNGTTNATDTFYVGITEVIWTVTDASGNTSSCPQPQIITVLDTEDPSLACPPNVTVANDLGFCGAEVEVMLALASDNCEIDTLYNTFNNTGDASDYYEVGETSVSWIALDINGNEFSCDMMITVIDTELPVIVCPDDITVVADLGTCEADLIVSQPQVTDNCSATFINDFNGTDNASGTFTGENMVVWTATDDSGNQATCTQVITVLDEEDPIITCPSDMVVDNDPGECGAVVNYPEVTATDNCAIDSMILLTGIMSGEYLPVGDTTITFQVFDTSGNSATCSFDVSVIDVEPPTIICPENISIEDTATVVIYDAIEVLDNCGYELIQIEGLASGEIFDHGITVNTFVVTDEGGNTAECSFEVLINLPPVAVDDVVTVTVTGGEIEIEPLGNDFDPDGDPFEITDYTVDIGEAILIDGDLFLYNAPEEWCGLAVINYTICDIYDACDDAEILINVNCPEELFIPEGISPDGDGSNDTFEIIGLWQYPNNKITVYNRWGHIVYEMENYNNDWDGTSTSDLTVGSSPLPRGTYFYLLDLGNDEEPIKGFVYVLNR